MDTQFKQAQFIQEQRKKLNLTQEYLADELKITRPTYKQIELGKRALTIPEAERLAEIFHIPLINFLKGKEEAKPTIKIEVEKESVKKAENEIRISIPQEKVDKFKEVLLYILKTVGGKPNIGMTVLYKLLYFIDFDYYEKHEEQLMGLTYIKNQFGPTPPIFEQVIDGLIKTDKVEKIKSKFHQYPQTKYLINPKIKPDLSILNGQEKEHIDLELNRLSDLTGTELSELSHKDVPWISAEEGKPLDYESVFYRTSDTSVRKYDETTDY